MKRLCGGPSAWLTRLPRRRRRSSWSKVGRRRRKRKVGAVQKRNQLSLLRHQLNHQRQLLRQLQLRVDSGMGFVREEIRAPKEGCL